METAADRFASYQICGPLRLGPGSVCFAALHPGLGRGLNADRKVALELSWDLTIAAEEARRLLRLGGKSGFPLLYDYFLIPFQRVSELLAPLHRSDEPLAPSEDQLIAVLVTQFAQGQELVKTEALDKVPRRLAKGSWLVEIDGKTFLQSMVEAFDQKGRVKVLRSLVKLVKRAHEQEPHQVCGELHPGCLWYDPDAGGEVRFATWQTSASYAAAAWQSPWHLERQAALPPAADIYQLALWVRRVLGGDDRAWRRFADSVLRQRDATKMPTIAVFERDFNRTAKKVEGRMDLRTRGLVGLGFAVLLAASALWLWRFYQVSPKKAEIARLRLEAKQGDTAAEVVAKLRGYLGEKEYQIVRQDLVESLGQIQLDQPQQTRFLAAIDWSKPSAVYVSRAASFVIYQGFAFQIGAPVSAEGYIAEIRHAGLEMVDREGKRRKVAFPKHPLVDGDGEGQFIMYDADLWEINAALSNLVGQKIAYCTFLRPRIFGLILEDSPSLVLANIRMSMDYHLDLTTLEESRAWYGFWDLREGTALVGDLGELARERLGKMGMDITGAEHLHKSIDVVLRKRTNCLVWFKEEAALAGARMELSADGRRVRFIPLGART